MSRLKKIVIALAVLVFAPPLAVVGYIVILSFFNGHIGVATDYTNSPMLQSPPPVLTAPVTLKLVTFNIQDTPVVGKDRPDRMRAIAAKLTILDPDVVCFQESFIEADRALLVESLADSRLVHHQYYESGRGSGLLLSSAWPIAETWFHRYTVANPWYCVWEGDWWAGKGVSLARIALPEGPVDIYNTHAQADYGKEAYQRIQEAQMGELAAFVNGSTLKTAPAFSLGDFNVKDGEAGYARLVTEANLERVMAVPSRIDHVFAVKNPHYSFEVVASEEIQEQVTVNGKEFSLSDHNGYMTTVRVAPVPAAEGAGT
ncbi:MAG: endonuclease/exonuclease/phosphatase family protein [Candidatus Hydrogenedentes bacterium]|nr:endonuclease/exonuclease/phosphatase family protein [Candidatus Hydrogenedentota bacterium]